MYNIYNYVHYIINVRNKNTVIKIKNIMLSFIIVTYTVYVLYVIHEYWALKMCPPPLNPADNYLIEE